MERTLVSVLEHRPPRTRIVVVLSTEYCDPYDLDGEVQFLHMPPTATWLAQASAGMAISRAEVIHLLACGSEVTDGWAAAPLAQFDSPNVAAVAPLVLDESGRVVSAGLADVAIPRRHVLRTAPAAASVCLGPTRMAGFYRRAALELLDGGFADAVGPRWADVDLALCLRRLGYTAVIEPASRVFAPPVDVVTAVETAGETAGECGSGDEVCDGQTGRPNIAGSNADLAISGRRSCTSEPWGRDHAAVAEVVPQPSGWPDEWLGDWHDDESDDSFAAGLFAERFFRRHWTAGSRWHAAASHGMEVLRDLCRALGRPAALPRLAGRMVASWQTWAYRRHERWLAAQAQHAADARVRSGARRVAGVAARPPAISTAAAAAAGAAANAAAAANAGAVLVPQRQAA
jgi:hypothetical protein